MKKSLLFFALLLSACGHEHKVDPEFQAYVQVFQDAGVANGREIALRDIGIQFAAHADMPKSDEGKAYDGYCDGSNVVIDRDRWVVKGEEQRNLLVLHELGHCVLGRDHRTDMQGGMPVSIMYPGVTDYYQIWDAHKDALLAELFR